MAAGRGERFSGAEYGGCGLARWRREIGSKGSGDCDLGALARSSSSFNLLVRSNCSNCLESAEASSSSCDVPAGAPGRPAIVDVEVGTVDKVVTRFSERSEFGGKVERRGW
jgi:hypothetical protein